MEVSYPNYNDLVGSQDVDFFDSQREIGTQDIENIVDNRTRDKDLNIFYSNSALNSEREGTVIIIKPAEAQSREIMNNPIELNRLITNSEFSKHKMKDIRVNKRRKLIVMQLENKNAKAIQELLKIKKLGEVAITSYIPDKDKYKYGVINPVSIRVSTDQLLDNIVDRETSVKVVKLERMKKRNGNEFIESESIKVVFEGERLPEGIKIGHSYYRVRPFVFSPVQCYHCQRLGHVANSCRSKVRCLICGEEHDKSQCKSNNSRCALCRGPHKANDKECVYVSNAREVEKRKANGERHSEAVSNVRKVQRGIEVNMTQTRRTNTNENAIVTVADVHHAMSSQVGSSKTYSSVLRRDRLERMETEIKSMQEKQKQMENSLTIMLGKVLEQHIIKLITKITECIADLFCSSITRESEANKRLVVQNIIKHHLPVQPKESEKHQEDYEQITEVAETDEENQNDVDADVLSNDGELSSDSMEENNTNKKKQNDKGRGKYKRKTSDHNEESAKGRKKKGKR